MTRRSVLVLSATIGAALIGGLLVPTAAQAATSVRAALSSASQDTYDHTVEVTGWAFDSRSPKSSVIVQFFVSGKYAGQVRASGASAGVDKTYRISGRHAYSFTFRRSTSISSVVAASRGISSTGPGTRLAPRAVKHLALTGGTRIVTVAKRYVGKARYVDGGASPKSGFDCSGYTQYVYSVAHVAKLPHNAQAQRTLKRMHKVSAAHAKPGDLVFYQSGGYTFHVAVYAGHHKQYAAATPRDGIRYQEIWSSDVTYGHYA